MKTKPRPKTFIPKYGNTVYDKYPDNLFLKLPFNLSKPVEKIPHTGDTNSLDRCGY